MKHDVAKDLNRIIKTVMWAIDEGDLCPDCFLTGLASLCVLNRMLRMDGDKGYLTNSDLDDAMNAVLTAVMVEMQSGEFGEFISPDNVN
jgi:hypothetical protein